MRRRLIGILAILFFLAAVILWLWPAVGGEGWRVPLSGCCRGAALLAALWLAYDDLHMVPAWLWVATPLLILILVRWPRWFLVAIPVILVLAILRPRSGRRA